MLTWNIGIFDCWTIGYSTFVYVVNGTNIAATFSDTSFWTTLFMTSGSCAFESSLTSSSGRPPTPPAALISSIASS